MYDDKKIKYDYYANLIGTYDVKKLREHYGLKPVRRGDRHCLRCDRLFFSEDLTNIKMCNLCKSIGTSL